MCVNAPSNRTFPKEPTYEEKEDLKITVRLCRLLLRRSLAEPRTGNCRDVGASDA